MTSSLFKKVAATTDIRDGLKSDSVVHNKDLIDWFIAGAQNEGCETAMFLGDWHTNRNSLNIGTMDYSIRKPRSSIQSIFLFPIHTQSGDNDYANAVKQFNSSCE